MQGSSSNQTYNSNYPWLNEKSYREMMNAVDSMGLSWEEKTQATNTYYRDNVKYFLNNQTLDERDDYINQQAYEAAMLQNEDADAQMRMTQLSQDAKRQWNLQADAPDLDVFTDIVKSLWAEWMNLAWQYLAWENNDLLYAAWLREKIEAPETPESSVWGMQSIINKQSEMWTDTTLGKVNVALDRANLPWKVTQWVDGLVQKIPVATYDTQVKNLATKMNNLSDEELGNLYDRYVNMIKNWTDEKWNDDDRWVMELIWDGLMWDQDALDRVNTLQLYDYSDVINQDNIEKNKRWNQLIDKLGAWEMNEDMEAAYNRVENLDTNNVVKWLAKASIRGADKTKNLLNFAWWVYGSLQNYAEALGAWLQHLDDIRDKRYASTEWLATDEDAFEAFVANKVANFGEYMTDAPDTLLGKPTDPNVIKFFSNIPQSFIKTVSAQVRWKTNQLDSKIWLLNLLFTEEWQEAIWNRYGTPEAFANSINTDPVGTADDLIDLADKFSWLVNTASWWGERERIWSLMDAVSDWIVNGKWTVEINWKNYDVYWINQWLTKVSDRLWDKWYQRTANLVNLERDISTDPSKIRQDAEEIAYQWAEDLGKLTRAAYDEANDLAYKAWELAWDIKNKLESMWDGFTTKSADVWKKARETATRSIPEKVVEGDLKLTPTERANVERNWITAANFILKEWIAWIDNADKIIALQDIATDAYNNVTKTFKEKIPETERSASDNAKEMLNIMIEEMESSNIVKNKYKDYIAKLKDMVNYDDYSPYEKLAIRRDFDAIVGNDVFNSKGRVTNLEDEVIAWYRAGLNDEINELWDKYWLDVRGENSRISNAITIRDWLIRSTSQWKKNNYLTLQDLWVGAVLTAWDPIKAWLLLAWKKTLENKSWKIAQTMYNWNDEELAPANTQKWPWFIKKWNKNAQGRFMIPTD